MADEARNLKDRKNITVTGIPIRHLLVRKSMLIFIILFR